MNNDKKLWYNYVIFSTIKTYVGVTVDLNRRIRQHNRIIKGGAKYTRNNTWHYYCVIFNLHNEKKICLSEEWHIKYFCNRKVKKSYNTYDKRCKGIEMYYKTRPYDYIMFINKTYINKYIPKLRKNVFIFIIDDFSMENINKHIEMFKKFTNYLHP